MKLNYSKKILLISLLVFSLVLVSDVIFTSLLLSKIIDINDKVKQLEISSQQREKELKLKESVDRFSPDREKLLQYFVGAGNAETVKFTKYLEDLALEAGVVQRKFLDYDSTVVPGSLETVSAVRYQFNISGRWTNVFTFLQMIETLPKVMSLSSVSFTVGTGASGAKAWVADLDFFVVKLKI